MDNAPDITDELLLDYLLERCDQQEAVRVALVIERDNELAARFQRLRSRLAPLETWTTPPPPAGMVSDILDNIAAHDARAALRGEGPPVGLPAVGEGAGGRGWIISLREVLALAACIAIFVGLFGPGISVVRQSARRQMCAGNLASLGSALGAYVSDNRQYLPYAGPQTGPFIRQPGKRLAPNTRHLYPLLKRGYVSGPRVFICPGCRDDRPMQEEDIDRCSDFPDSCNRSYHLQLMGRPVRIRIVARPFVMPYVSDANPMFERDTFNEDVDPATANSTAHRGRGQNVLHVDGHVGWYKTPIMGSIGDNMWQIANLRHYSGNEAPTAATDVFMAP